MNYPTQFLKMILILIMVIIPLGFGSNVSYFINGAIRKKGVGFNLLGMVIAYSLILILVWIAGYGDLFYFKSTSILLYLCSPILGIICILGEYAIGVLSNFILTKKWVFKISVHSSYSKEAKIEVFDILIVGAFVIIEELIFRQVLYNLLFKNFGMKEITVLIICSLVFALNHINYGVVTVPQKILSGLIYSLFYMISGYCILVPIIGHMVQNFSLLYLSRAGDLK